MILDDAMKLSWLAIGKGLRTEQVPRRETARDGTVRDLGYAVVVHLEGGSTTAIRELFDYIDGNEYTGDAVYADGKVSIK
jgi:hypothetical protein